MKTGWLQDIDNKWYYLKSSGDMAANETVEGLYYVNTSGEWVDSNNNASQSNYTVGEVIRFGNYDWIVLDTYSDGKALIITQNVIEKRGYHDEMEDSTWADCGLRAYLNGDFYNSFSTADRQKIASTTIANKDNQWYGTEGGVDTTDKIFLLSLEEVVKYFGDSGQLKNGNPNSAYYIDDGYSSNRIAKDSSGTAEWWWLRSPGHRSFCAAFVGSDGSLNVYGNNTHALPVYRNIGGVRPALILNP